MNMMFEALGRAYIDPLVKPDAALFLHIAIFVAPGQTVSDETFRLQSFSGSDSVSEPFEYRLELRANDSVPGRLQLAFDQLIGKPVTFAVSLPLDGGRMDATAIEQSSTLFQAALQGMPAPQLCFFNGIVASFAMAGPGNYQLTVRPALWRLTLANRYQIYDDRTIAQAIGDVLAKHAISADMAAVGGLAVQRTQDWLQAGESDFEFLRRLMGKAHLYYYFRHSPQGHQLVFSNQPGYPDEVLPGRSLRYTFSDQQENGLAQFDVISDYRYQQNLNINAVHTVFARQYEGWQVDGVPPIVRMPQMQQYVAEAGSAGDDEQVFHLHKVYQYGLDQHRTEEFGESTALASRTAASQLSGQSYCALFRAGYRFSMREEMGPDCAPQPVRPSLDGKPFVLSKVEHEASLDGGYQNKFEATEADGLLAAFSLSETQQGTVLAVVVDHAGPRMPATWKYLEKTDFDPQQQNYYDPPSDQPELTAQGAYVQLITDSPGTRRWVKLAVHMQTVPDIGAHVIVGRASDESELPELQQVVVSVGNKTVTPSTWLANTSVGNNYSTRYGDSINIGFGKDSQADLAKAVAIDTTAYGSGVFRDAGYSQGASYNFSTSEATAKSAQQNLPLVYGPYKAQGTDLLGVSEAFGSNYSRSEGQVQSSYSVYDISYGKSHFGQTENYTVIDRTSYSENENYGKITNKSLIIADSESTTNQTGNVSDTRIQVGDTTSSVTQTGNTTSSNTQIGNTSNTQLQTGNITTSTTQTGNTSNTTMQTGTITSNQTHIGDSNNTSTQTGTATSNTTIIGTSDNTSNITTQKNNSTIGSSSSTDNIGSQSSDSSIGSQSSKSTIGKQDSNSVTGMSNSMQITGMNNSMSITGMHNSMNILGNSNSLDISGATTNLSIQGAGLSYKIAGAILEGKTVLLEIEIPSIFKIVL